MTEKVDTMTDLIYHVNAEVQIKNKKQKNPNIKIVPLPETGTGQLK